MELKLKLGIMYKKQGPKVCPCEQVPCLAQGGGSEVAERLTEEMMEGFHSARVEPFIRFLLLASLFPPAVFQHSDFEMIFFLFQSMLKE